MPKQAGPIKTQEDAFISVYASEADAEAVSTLIQWEMKEAGYSVPWHVRGQPENFMQGYFCFANMHRVFEDATKKGGTKLDATRAVFRAWHANKPILNSYEGQGKARWIMQDVIEQQRAKWEKVNAEAAARKKLSDHAHDNAEEPRLAPRPPDDELIPHT